MKNKCWFVIIGFTLSIQACLRPVDGCINPRAKDFNPEADRNTTCDYYDIYYDFEHRLRDTVLMTDSTSIWDMDSSGYYVNQLYLFLYQSHLRQENNTTTFTSISDITYQRR